jgi:hypothetical protein
MIRRSEKDYIIAVVNLSVAVALIGTDRWRGYDQTTKGHLLCLLGVGYNQTHTSPTRLIELQHNRHHRLVCQDWSLPHTESGRTHIKLMVVLFSWVVAP